MHTSKRKIILFGLGYFEQRLLEAVAQQWHTIAIDMNEEKIERLKKTFPTVEFYVGDASSILTWKKLKVEEIVHVITTIHDMDVNLEICRILREVFSLEVPITVVSYAVQEDPRLEKFGVTILNPMQLGIGFVLNKLEKNYVKAVDIGLRKGEIIEVPILTKSHLVDKKLRMLRPTKWHVAAIYREGRMIIPSGDNEIKLKDRIVLLGEPKVLETVANILLMGDPQFPTQFGSTIVCPAAERYSRNDDELKYIKEHIRVERLEGYPYRSSLAKSSDHENKVQPRPYETCQPIGSLLHLFDVPSDAGLAFLPYSHLARFERMALKLFMKKATVPLLLSRLRFPYEAVIVSLNCPDPAYALELGIDLSRLFKIPFNALYITMPKALKDPEEDDRLKKRGALIADFEGIHKRKIPLITKEGNPVKETLHILKAHQNALLVLVYDKATRFSLFQPHIQYHLAKKSPLSTLLVPTEALYEP